MHFLLRFFRDEDGQDLTEYSLGVAFVALLSAAVFMSAGASTSGIWAQANNTLSGASSSLAGPAAAPGAPADPNLGNDGGDHGGDHDHDHGGDGHGG